MSDSLADRPRIIVVDDDDLVLRTLEQIFMDDYQVTTASSGQEVIDLVQKDSSYETIVLDIKMARMDGFEAARQIRKVNPDIPIIFHTGYPGDYSEEQIDGDHKPYDYVTKSEHPARLSRTVRNAIELYRLKTQKSRLVDLAREQYNMIGRSPAMRKVFERIEQVAMSDNKVMILGPTGSGKELVARAIHKRSRRSDKRLAVLNTSHKPFDLVASELFGHIRGAFTGAISDRVGLFEYANGGTVFLDEIGDIDPITQEGLLRVLEDGIIQQLGSPETRKVDVRVLCATHRDLKKMVSEGQFREDLYYRLAGVTIQMPSLEERREDIPALIDFFTDSYCAARKDGIWIFDPSAIDLMIEYDWPGNVRQLRDGVESLIDLAVSSYISRDEAITNLGISSAPVENHDSLACQVREFKRTLIIKTLARHENNRSAAARELEIDPGNFHRMLRSLGIDLV